MMEELEYLLQEREIEFDKLDRRVMCFPHVINICVKHVLDKFSNIDLADDACRRNPIALARQIVKVIRASGLRRDKFMSVVKAGNLSGTFQLPEYQLLRDVSTRWDSVYYMINRLRVMRPVSRFRIVVRVRSL